MIDVDKVNGNDGVLGPHREKEGSYYAIRKIFSPVHIRMAKLPDDFNGVIPEENRFHFTNLDKCVFTMKLVRFNKPGDWLTGFSVLSEQSVKSPDIAPGDKGTINLQLPAEWQQSDAIILTANDQFNEEIYSWTSFSICWRRWDYRARVRNAVSTAAPPRF